MDVKPLLPLNTMEHVAFSRGSTFYPGLSPVSLVVQELSCGAMDRSVGFCLVIYFYLSMLEVFDQDTLGCKFVNIVQVSPI